MNLLQVECYLCNKPVTKRYWTNGSHRENCAMKEHSVLNAIPLYQGERGCPQCGGRFMVWPKDKGGNFVSEKYLVNRGNKRQRS